MYGLLNQAMMMTSIVSSVGGQFFWHHLAFTPCQTDMRQIHLAGVTIQPTLAIQKERIIGFWWFGMVVGVLITAHDDALLAVECFDPFRIGEQPIRRGDPRGAVGQKEIFARHLALVRFDAVPNATVHDRQRSLAHAENLFAGDAFVGVVGGEILLAVAPWVVDKVAYDIPGYLNTGV